jgi:hypothetical protein
MNLHSSEDDFEVFDSTYKGVPEGFVRIVRGGQLFDVPEIEAFCLDDSMYWTPKQWKEGVAKRQQVLVDWALHRYTTESDLRFLASLGISPDVRPEKRNVPQTGAHWYQTLEPPLSGFIRCQQGIDIVDVPAAFIGMYLDKNPNAIVIAHSPFEWEQWVERQLFEDCRSVQSDTVRKVQ